MKNPRKSCGMSWSKDPKHGGTYADGSISTDYCSYCYVNGSFANADFSARQMQDFCVQKLQERGTPKPLAWLLTRNIPRLARWTQA